MDLIGDEEPPVKSSAWFTVAISAADSVGIETDWSRRLGSVLGERAKRYIESSKNSEKMTTNLKKNVDIFMYHMFKIYHLAH